MMSEPARGAVRAISRPEAKRRLSNLADDLARHVDYLKEEGVTAVERLSAIAPEIPPAPAASVSVAQPQPKQNIDLSAIALATAEHPTMRNAWQASNLSRVSRDARCKDTIVIIITDL